MYRYDTCIVYDMYPIRRYVYFKNNRIWCVIDRWYMYIEKCTTIVKNIINILLSLYESKLNHL